MICGLDISTSITGITILNTKGEILLNDSWDFRKYKTFLDKVDVAKQHIQKLHSYGIEHIYIEQSLQAFRPGFSSAKTILTLAKFNGTISYLLYDILSIRPEYVAATTARKLNGIKVPRGQKAKEVVLQHLLSTEPGFKIEMTKFGNPKPESYDRADSLIVARAGHTMMQKEVDKS
tara:strand:- start:1608 stop:2135 length:528 start_codon:yes stop_codon:yes gene_type:complete